MTSVAACPSQESDVSIAERFLTPLFANTETKVGLKAAQSVGRRDSVMGRFHCRQIGGRSCYRQVTVTFKTESK